MVEECNNYFVRTGIKLIQLLRKHFPIEGQNENVHLYDTVRPEYVESFYTEYIASVRPPQLRNEKIFPKPNYEILRALYLGSPSANSLLNNLVRHSLYSDQILLTDPFQSIVMLDSAQNVREDPGIWMDVVVNRAIALIAISDWIESDIVRVIPNAFYYHRDVLFQSADELEERGITIPKDFGEQVVEDFIIELLLSQEQSTWNDLLDSIEGMGNPMSADEREYFKSRAIDYQQQFPIRFRASSEILDKYKYPQGFPSKMISSGGGTPVHLAPDVAKLTGSFMLFERKSNYNLFIENFQHDSPTEFQEIALAFQDLTFPFLHNVPIDVALDAHREGYLSKFRSYLRETWQIAGANDPQIYSESASQAFRDKLNSEFSDLENEWTQIRNRLRLGAISHGIISGASAIVAGTIHWTIGATGLLGTLASSIKDYREISSQLDQASRNPLAIFINLSRKGD